MSEQRPESLDQSEVLDQLQPDDTLVDRGVEDVLDEGYSPAENYGPGEGFGTTAAEERQGESLEQRLAQEEPDIDPYAEDDSDDESEYDSDAQIGSQRAGRLVDAGGGYDAEDDEPDLVGGDVGIDGAAASAEEAAVHIIED